MIDFNLTVKKASFATSKHVLGVFPKLYLEHKHEILQEEVILAAIPESQNGNQSATAMLKHLMSIIVVDIRTGIESTETLDILSLPQWNTLTVEYGVDAEFFSFKSLIKDVTMTLLQKTLLFEPAFDFWRLFTLYWRVCTNQFGYLTTSGSQHFDAIGKSYSLFNHSCEPNAEWGIEYPVDDDNQPIGPRIVMDTMTSIHPEEEIFISYLDAKEMAMPVTDRRAILRSWFGDDCHCKKCVAEAALPSTPTEVKNKKLMENAAKRIRQSPPRKKRAGDDSDYAETPRKARIRKKAKVDKT
jgi:hypothetical protein